MSEINKIKVLHEVSHKWEWFMKIADIVHYGRITEIQFRGKDPKFVRLVYDLDFENEEDLKKQLEELRTLPII